MSINVKKGQRVTCKQSVVLKPESTRLAFTCGREYCGVGDNLLLDNFMAGYECNNTAWFKQHFTLNTFTPVIKNKQYHLSYDFLGVAHEQVFDTPFEFGEAYCRIMDLAEVPQDSIDFKVTTI